MSKASLLWTAALGTLAVVDYLLDRRHRQTPDEPNRTLSTCTRTTFRCDTPLGRAAFRASWAGLTLVVVPHICKEDK